MGHSIGFVLHGLADFGSVVPISRVVEPSRSSDRGQPSSHSSGGMTVRQTESHYQQHTRNDSLSENLVSMNPDINFYICPRSWYIDTFWMYGTFRAIDRWSQPRSLYTQSSFKRMKSIILLSYMC